MLAHPCHRQHLVTRPSCPVWSGHRAPPPDPFLVALALGVISVRIRALAYRHDAPGQLVPGRTRLSPRALLLGAFRADITTGICTQGEPAQGKALCFSSIPRGRPWDQPWVQ